MADPAAAASTTDTTIDWAKLLYGIYKDQNPTQGKFQQVPMSPEQQAIYAKTFGWMNTGGPTNAALAPGIVSNMKANNPEFTLPGYIGAQAGQPNALPNGGHVGGAPTDWDAMLKGLLNPAGGSSSTSTPTPAGANGSQGSGPTGVPGDAFGSISSAPGSPGDPFANLPPDYAPTDWKSLISMAKGYGPAAGEFALALMQGNPFLGVKAGFDALKNYMKGNKTTPSLPGNPNDFGPGNFDPNAPAPRVNLDPGSKANPGLADPWSSKFTFDLMNAPGQLGASGGAGSGSPFQGNNIFNSPTRHGEYR